MPSGDVRIASGWNEEDELVRRERDRASAPARVGAGRIAFLLGALVWLLGAASPVEAVDCSSYPGGVLDGFAGGVAPSQIQIDTNCTIRNFPASNPLDTNFSF